MNFAACQTVPTVGNKKDYWGTKPHIFFMKSNKWSQTRPVLSILLFTMWLYVFLMTTNWTYDSQDKEQTNPYGLNHDSMKDKSHYNRASSAACLAHQKKKKTEPKFCLNANVGLNNQDQLLQTDDVFSYCCCFGLRWESGGVYSDALTHSRSLVCL